MSNLPLCPLCHAGDGYPIAVADRSYQRCRRCMLVFLDRAFHLDEDAEKAVYDCHENAVNDPGYRRFLARSLAPLLAHRPPPAHGLDFGCGPAPALVAMAREAGYTMDAYDKFYAPDRAVFERRYDFITCTEVAEHLAEPGAELTRLWRLLVPGGVLVVQTKRVLDDARFKTWFYRNDPTHIVFFSGRSFAWLAQQWQAELQFPCADVAVLTKRPLAAS